MNKKASVQDVGVAMVFFFIAAVLFLIVTYSYGAVVDKIKLNPKINSSQVTIDSFNATKALTSRYDYVSVAILLGFTLAIIITGWLVPVNSIFIWVYGMLLMVFIMLSAVFSYVWDRITLHTLTQGGSVNLFATTLTSFPVTNHILTNFPVYITIIGFLGMLVMFAKPQQGGYQ